MKKLHKTFCALLSIGLIAPAAVNATEYKATCTGESVAETVPAPLPFQVEYVFSISKKGTLSVLSETGDEPYSKQVLALCKGRPDKCSITFKNKFLTVAFQQGETGMLQMGPGKFLSYLKSTSNSKDGSVGQCIINLLK